MTVLAVLSRPRAWLSGAPVGVALAGVLPAGGVLNGAVPAWLC